MVVVLDAPDEQAMVAGMLKIAGAGNVHSETLRAFTAEEMTQILKKLE